jgi:hypothetical protein
MEPWRAVDAHSGGLEAQNGALKVFLDQWSQIPITLMRSRIRIWIRISWIRIRIEVKSWIWIRVCIKVMRIRNLEYYTCGPNVMATFYQF